MRPTRERILFFALLPALLLALVVVGTFTLRSTLQSDSLRKQSVLEATVALATEKANRLDRLLVDQDNVVVAIADPARLEELEQRWLPTARRETPTIRAIFMLDEAGNVVASASRSAAAWAEDDGFRRLLAQRLRRDMDLTAVPEGQLRHLHGEYEGRGVLVSFWQKRDVDGHLYLVVAWHDIGRIVTDTLPRLYGERDDGKVEGSSKGSDRASRVNIVDEEGRLVFGPKLKTGDYTVGVRFPTTLYNWRLQVSQAAADELAASLRARRLIEVGLVSLSSLVIFAGVVTILVASARERRMSAMKSEFVANVSHELKTPLALIRMFADNLVSGRVGSEAKRREYLEVILRESERLGALIENVLDFAQVERGKFAFFFEEGDVGALTKAIVDGAALRAQERGIDLVFTKEGNTRAAAVDPRALEMAIGNLVDNAMKYGIPREIGEGIPDSQQARPGIVVRVVARGDKVRVEVRDRGPGVASSDQRRIFERFVRAVKNDGETAGIRGSGIGLALVTQIARAHRGAVWVERNCEDGLEKGACFVLELPKSS